MFVHPTKTHINTPETSSITANNRINHIENIQTNAKQAHEVAKNLINQRIKSKLLDLKAGIQVWLDSQHIQIKGTPKKLAPKHIGPFKFLERTSVMLYKHLGKISDNLHPNNQNNRLERRAQSSHRHSPRCPVVDSSI